jgi:hypothetical protein
MVLFLSKEYLDRNINFFDASHTIHPRFLCCGILWFAEHYFLGVLGSRLCWDGVPGRNHPWTNCPLNATSPGRTVPWTNRPLDEPSPGRTVPWTNRPLDEPSPRRTVPWTNRPLEREPVTTKKQFTKSCV